MIATKSGLMAAGPQSYAHVAATIPPMPQAIRQATHKPTETHEITIYIGNTANCEEALKQNSQALVHKLQAVGPPDTHRIQAVKKLQSGNVRAYVTDKGVRDRLL